MNTLEQEFAAKIYTQVKQYETDYPKEDSKERKKYGSMSHKLPILVRKAGLAQALAFVDSRGQAPHHDLLEHLAQVVVDDNTSELLKQSRESDLQTYMYLTRRTMLALAWYKRFAQSILKVKSTDSGEEED